ncbi:TPA: hypothetical protein QC364_000734 [Bacillus cereus]|nr:hypothetical protein [Bacillus cereus]
MKLKAFLSFILALGLLIPSTITAQAGGFSGGSSARSSVSSSSVSRSSSSFSSSRPSSSSSSSKVSLSKSSSSSSKSSSSGTFSGKTSTKSSTSSGSFSGKTSTKASASTVRGKTYTSAPTRTYVNGRSVTVNHYYHAGYSPSGWFGYYSGFTTGMFMGSLMHPWGHTYPVHGTYTTYGASPIAWVVDIILLIIILIIVIATIKALKPSKTYTRRF